MSIGVCLWRFFHVSVNSKHQPYKGAFQDEVIFESVCCQPMPKCQQLAEKLLDQVKANAEGRILFS